jgi:hypothetical protein
MLAACKREVLERGKECGRQRGMRIGGDGGSGRGRGGAGEGAGGTER